MSLALRPSNTTVGALDALLRSPLGRALTAPHGPDRYLELLDPLRVRGELRARIAARRTETGDCATLTLAPGRRWPAVEPGQHVQVGVSVDGVRCTRCFSVSSAGERTDGCLEITVKAHEGGHVSQHLVHRAAVGEVVTLSAPAGEFVLPEPRPQRLLLISGGSGITPVMAMLRALCAEGHAGEVVFLHYARGYRDLIFGDELDALARAHPNLRLVRSVTGETPRPGDAAGHFRGEHLAGLTAPLADYAAFACGPAPLIEAVQGHWHDAGAAGRLAVEHFQPPRRAAADEGGRVTFAASGVAADDTGASLLETAEAAGLTPDYGCRMGICHTCTCRKTEGTVRNLVTGRLSGAGAEDIQPCVSAPVGDVTLAL